MNKWGSGPSVGFVKKDQGPWVLGAVVNNIWSFGGPPDSSDRTNSFYLNPSISYHLGDGWSISSSPEITANWLSQPGQQWTVPVGGGVAKMFHIAGQHVQLSVDGYYNVVRSQAAHDTWLIQVTLTVARDRNCRAAGDGARRIGAAERNLRRLLPELMAACPSLTVTKASRIHVRIILELGEGNGMTLHLRKRGEIWHTCGTVRVGKEIVAGTPIRERIGPRRGPIPPR
ncbi:MAG: hypothetical protein JO122_01700, partial [Acetobacteraceae bacterium]|nr:hypothetical protein [Acetobacteraceae bacterium]